MSTLRFTGHAKLSTATVSQQVLIDSNATIEVDSYNRIVWIMEPGDSKIFSAGSDKTIISTSLANENAMTLIMDGVSYNFVSLAILPGGVGEIRLNNITEYIVRVEILIATLISVSSP